MKQVKTFTNSDVNVLSAEISRWIEKEGANIEVIDIKIDVGPVHTRQHYWAAVVYEDQPKRTEGK